MLTVIGRTCFTSGANEGIEASVRSLEGATGVPAAPAGEVVDSGARSASPRQPDRTRGNASTNPETAMQKTGGGDEREGSMGASCTPTYACHKPAARQNATSILGADLNRFTGEGMVQMEYADDLKTTG
jgi:hypothetical protein